MKVDVVIVGAGPAGTMAACRLAGSGLRIALLEKSPLPRAKACGGAMPVEMKGFFGWDIGPVIEAEASRIRWLYNHEREKEVNAGDTCMVFVERRRFDFHLVEKALLLNKGDLVLRDGFAVERVVEESGAVTVYGGKGEALRASFVVGADGANSRVARSLGLHRKAPFALAATVDIEVPADTFAEEKDRATFNFFCVPHGYGWIFPRAGYLNVGVGSWSEFPGIHKALDGFLERSFPGGSRPLGRPRTRPLPIYAGARPIATRRVCLAGDAAGLIEPVTGEGIRPALVSGSLAAEVIAGLFGQEAGAGILPGPEGSTGGGCIGYQQRIYQQMGEHLETVYRYGLPVFLHAPEFYYRKFILKGLNPAWYFAEVGRGLSGGRRQAEGRDEK